MTFFNPTDEFVDKLVEVINGRLVIEIGCGKGDLLQELIKRNVKCIGIDPYVDRSEMDIHVRAKVMQYTLHEAYDFIKKLSKETETVFLTARPCHSGFPQEYLDMFGREHELIYIGYAKNLEIDFHRELSLIRMVDFPDHPDCDTVAILKEGNYDDEYRKRKEWDKIDAKVREIKGEVNEELAEWFISRYNKDSFYKKTDEILKKIIPGFIAIKGSTSGNEWEDFKDELLLSEQTKIREVKLGISSYNVGGGHFYNTIEVKNEEFLIKHNEEGYYYTATPWDRLEHRPEWANYNNLRWFGIRDSKRTSNVEAGLEWLKQSYEELVKKYKEIGIELVISIESTLIYELEDLGFSIK